MTSVTVNGLPRPWQATIIRARVKYVTFMVLSLLAHEALAQRAPLAPDARRDDLDVTMQIIVDPDAKLPDEVVRRIPLPERKSAATPDNQSQSKGNGNDKAAPQDKSSASDAREAARDTGQTAKERAREAKEQREQARRAEAEERRRNNNNPNPPPNPPGRPPRP
jgi:hypothetical protein